MRVGIIIPAYEPDGRLLNLLENLEMENMGPIYIVNDGSGDQYDEIFQKASVIAERSGGLVLKHQVNRGKGRALKTAFAYILEHCNDIEAAVTADSDGQHTPECIRKVMDAVYANKNCLILGVRSFDMEGIPWKSRFGNNLTEKIFQYISGVHVSDTQTGLRGISKSYMKELLDLKGERFEFEMRMLLDAANRYRIVEVPIKTVYDSEENHQTHFNPIKDSIKIYRILGEKFLKYIFSSFSSSILDLILFGILCAALKTVFPVFYAAAATIAARVVSATYNYFLNYKVVFHSNESVMLSVTKYFALAVIQMACSAVIVTLLVNVLPVVPEVIIKMVIDTMLFFVSYHIQQKYIFK